MSHAVELPPPRDWQVFEDFCRDLFAAEWDDPETQKHGRPGQKQHGVDIIGRRGDRWQAVQCKRRSTFPEVRLTEREVRAEIEAAGSLPQSLETLIIATTAPPDTHLQALARRLTMEHGGNGPRIVIYGWSDLCEKLEFHVEELRIWQRKLLAQAPTPSFTDAASRELAEALEAAQLQYEELVCTDGDPSKALEQMLNLKRQLREGGQLQAGDYLANGRFRLLEERGRGGFATVFKAYDRQGQELVAVKVLHGQLARDRTRRERFFRGARKMAQLQHQGIVRVIEPQLEESGYQFFVMEYVDGGDLRQAVLEGRLTGVSGLNALRPVAEALGFAHSKKIVHRDVKPANILLTATGEAKLTDFDLVRAHDSTGGTRTGRMLGTIPYVAPEAMTHAKSVDEQADLYSLAMTMVFVLAGKELPITVIRGSKPLIDGLDGTYTLKQALATATSWEPTRRPLSVLALWQVVEREAQQSPATIVGVDPSAPEALESTEPTQPEVHRHPSPLGKRELIDGLDRTNESTSQKSHLAEGSVEELSIFKIMTFRYLLWSFRAAARRRIALDKQGDAARAVFLAEMLTVLATVAFGIVIVLSAGPMRQLSGVLLPLCATCLTLLLCRRHGIVLLPLLSLNIYQAFSLDSLIKSHLINPPLLLTLIIQCALILPSFETFEKAQYASVFRQSGVRWMTSWFSSLASKVPNAISQFYRSYILIVAATILLFTAQLSAGPASGAKGQASLLNSPISSALVAFGFSLAAIFIASNSTSSVSGWERGRFTAIRENTQMIFSLYGLVILFLIAASRMSLTITTSGTNAYAILDLLFAGTILYAFLNLGKKLKERPAYSVSRFAYDVIENNAPLRREVVFALDNRTSADIDCRVVNERNLALEGPSRQITCSPGVTALAFEYKGSLSRSLHDAGFADIEVSRRKYKHRLFYSALRMKAPEDLTPTSGEARPAVTFDRLALFDTLSLEADSMLEYEAFIGLYNTTKTPREVRVWNKEALLAQNFVIDFISGSKEENLQIAPSAYLPKAVRISFRYSDLRGSLGFRGQIITQLRLEIDSFQHIALPIVIEIEPKIYNDTAVPAFVEYPDGSTVQIGPGEVSDAIDIHVPARMLCGKEKPVFTRIHEGINLISDLHGSVKPIERKSFLDIALLGLPGSGKTTFLAMLASECQEIHSSLILVQQFRHKKQDLLFEGIKNDLRNKDLFPAGTCASDFDLYNFVLFRNGKRRRIRFRDVTGEYFRVEMLREDESLPRRALAHLSGADFVFVFIDTEPETARARDHETVSMLRLLEGARCGPAVIIFSKTDLSGVDQGNYLEWMTHRMPETMAYLLAFPELTTGSHHFITVGSVEEGSIRKYSPANVLRPLEQVL